MIRPISLFLLIGILVANHASAATHQLNIIWLMFFLLLVPIISIATVQVAKQAKVVQLFATCAVLLSWFAAVYFFSWAIFVQQLTQNMLFVEDFFVVIPAIFWLLVLWFVTSPSSNRMSWVSHRFRLDIFLLLAPVFFLFAVSDVVVLCGVSEENVGIIELLVCLLLLAFAPFFISKILSAKPMSNYELCSSISDIGKMAGVRRANILVWNTHNRIMNALAIGVIFQPKTIVLTDKLIANLTQQELLSVTAHEFGHHKYWHIPFLLFTTITVIIWSNKILLFLGVDMSGEFVFVLQCALMVVAIILVSRMFEKQADAYAAVALSAASGSDSVTPEGASSLASALGAIAQTQCINPSRKDLLHGSIALRQCNLQALVGCSFSGIPINKRVFFLKIGLVASFLIGIFI